VQENYSIIPTELECAGKYLCPLSNVNVRLESTTTSRSPAKKKMCTTHPFSEAIHTDTNTDDEAVDADIAVFQKRLPIVVTQLRDAGVIKPWLQFHKLV
jgi:hypothetical protein